MNNINFSIKKFFFDSCMSVNSVDKGKFTFVVYGFNLIVPLDLSLSFWNDKNCSFFFLNSKFLSEIKSLTERFK